MLSAIYDVSDFRYVLRLYYLYGIAGYKPAITSLLFEVLGIFEAAGTPVGFGVIAGIYFERSNVDFLSAGTLDYFFENSDIIFDELGVPEDNRAEFMQHIQLVNNAINENSCQDECIEK